MLKALNDFKASILALKLCKKCQPTLQTLFPEQINPNANTDSDVAARADSDAADADIRFDKNQAQLSSLLPEDYSSLPPLDIESEPTLPQKKFQ